MGTQSKLGKYIINRYSKMVLVVTLFFSIHPYFEPKTTLMKRNVY